MGKEFGDSWPDKWTCYMKEFATRRTVFLRQWKGIWFCTGIDSNKRHMISLQGLNLIVIIKLMLQS